jgi:hypothetical protein
MANISSQQPHPPQPPQPTYDPTYQMNTLELKNNINDSHQSQSLSMSEKLSYIVVLAILGIHVYLIYQTHDIIYKVLLLICFISIIWLLNKKNKNQNINTVMDDDGVNLIEG